MTFEPRTRRESVLLRACELIADKCNRDVAPIMVKVAIVQAEEQIPPLDAPQVIVDYHYKWKEPA